MADRRLEIQAGDFMRRAGLRLAVAESCTGGLVGHRITEVPGSSDYFLGGVVAYADETKVRLLGVSRDTLARCGAVSEEVAIEMARGARAALQADIGMAVTGIAGPGGGMGGKPVGLTWIGLSSESAEKAWQFVWDGDRSQNKERSAEQLLQLLVDYLKERRNHAQ